MLKSQIEFNVLSIVDRVQKGEQIEDSRYELKSELIPPAKAARRIAAHANAAGGDQIIWIIGLNEKTGELTSVKRSDYENWFQKVISEFVELYPDIIELFIPYQNQTILALIIETDRAPFVIKSPEGKAVQYEVPWREGTMTRSAKRSDLLKILVPAISIPKFDFLKGDLTFYYPDKNPESKVFDWHFKLHIYITPFTDQLIAFPFHQCQSEISFSEQISLVSQKCRFGLEELADLYGGDSIFKQITDSSRNFDSQTATRTRDELLIWGPGKVIFNAWGTNDIFKFDESNAKGDYQIIFKIATSNQIIKLNGSLKLLAYKSSEKEKIHDFASFELIDFNQY